MKIEKNKIIIYLGILLAAQILVYVMINIFSSQNLKNQAITKPLLNGLKKDNVVSLEIKDKESDFTIKKKDSDWIITVDGMDLPGDKDTIESYIDDLVKMPSGIVVYNGSDASSDSAFGFDEKSDQILTVKTKNKSYALNIGSPGSKRTSSYIKYNNEKKVREVASNISSSTSNTASMWAVKNIFSSIEFKDVKSLTITSKFDWFNGSYKITSNGLDGKELKLTIEPALAGTHNDFSLENEIRALLNVTVSDYKLKGSVDGKEIMGSFVLATAGKTISADVYSSDENDPGDYILKSSDSKYLYLITEEIAKMIFKNTNEFLKTEN